jgi:unsaturated chondroitin disaccharide hydrolase
MISLLQENKPFIQELWEKIEKKIMLTTDSIQDTMPYTTKNGKYIDANKIDPAWWTNSFWAGILWHMYRETKMIKFKEYAESIEKKFDALLMDYDGLHHDVGFMWLLTSVLNHEITGNDPSRKRAMLAASILSSRANIAGSFIRAWNGNNEGRAIIDCMMNIPLLYWASEKSKDSRFSHIATMHADKVIHEFIRPDGSSNHIVDFNTLDGSFLDNPAGQGYTSGSSWSRGQSWAIYGFIQSYQWTKDEKYLDTAKQIGHYILSNLAMTNYRVPCDYRQPGIPILKIAVLQQ